MNSKLNFRHRKPHLDNKAIISAQQNIFI